MPLRSRLEYQPETLQEFELAAEQKYRQAQALWAAGVGGGAIYLAGYAAEMLLKNSYFRFEGEGSTALVGPLLGPAKKAAQLLGVSARVESYHNVHFWALLLRAKRRDKNRPLPHLLDASLVQRSRRLYQNWWVEMRYRQSNPTSLETETVLDDVEWLRDNYVALWR